MKFGIESGGSAGIGAAVSIGPSLNIGPAIGGLRGGLGLSLPSFVREGPVSGFGSSLASLGSKLEGPTQSFVREGPIRGGLEMFKPIGQINFTNQSDLNAADAVLEAQSILAQGRPQQKGSEVPEIFQTGLSGVNLDPGIRSASQSESLPLLQSTNKVEPVTVSDGSKLAAVRERLNSFVAPQVQPDFMTLFMPAPALEPVIKPKNVLSTQVVNQPQVETKAAQALQTSLAPVVKEQQIEELVEEEVVGANEDTQIQSEDSENIKELKIQRVVDEPVIRQREKEITGAVQSAANEIVAEVLEENSGGQIKISEVEIAGERIGKYLPAQHKNNRSGELNIVDPDEKLLDGTLRPTFKEIISLKFSSVMDAIKRVPKIVAKHRPVTRGEGQLATDGEVAKVYDKYKGRIPPAQEVIKRVIRMVKQVKIVKRGQNPVQIIPIKEEAVERNEGTLQSQPDLAAALLVPASYNS